MFQPHRYTRTKFPVPELGECFKDANLVLLLPIYAASEPAIPGVTSALIADEIRQRMGADFTGAAGRERGGRGKMVEGERERAGRGPDSRGREHMGNWQRLISSTLNNGIVTVTLNEPLSKHTTFRIGGPAGALVTAKTVAGLKAALDFARRNEVRWKVFGAGSNLLVSGQGYPGMVIKLGAGFSGIERRTATSHKPPATSLHKGRCRDNAQSRCGFRDRKESDRG